MRFKMLKISNGNALVFQLKNSFVFQAQPCFPEYGSMNLPMCAGAEKAEIEFSVLAFVCCCVFVHQKEKQAERSAWYLCLRALKNRKK